MKKEQKVKRVFREYFSISNVMMVLVALAVIVISCHRLFFGVEITDEAYYIAEARLVAQGAVPFVDNWTQTPGHVLFYFWLVPLFESVSRSTEGLFVFMRIAFLIFKLLALGIVFLILRKKIHAKVLLLFLLPFVPFSPHNINMLSYNTVSFFLLLIVQALIIRLLIGSEDKAKKHAVWAGFVMALTCLAHPQNLLLTLYFLVLLTVFTLRNQKPLASVLAFVLSGLATAVAVIAALGIAGGSFSGLLNGLRTIIVDNPYFRIPKASLYANAGSFFGVVREHLGVMLLSAIVFCTGVYLRWHSRKRNPALLHVNGIIRVVVWVFLIAVTAYVLKLVLQYAPTARRAYTSVQCALFFVPFALLLLLPERHQKMGKALILAIWAPCIVSMIAVVITNWIGIGARYYLLYSGAMLSIIFFSMVLDDTPKRKDCAPIARTLSVFALALVLISSACIHPYMVMYRESPYVRLVYKIPNGVYKGIYTTKERGEALVALENELRILTNAQDDVLFMETVPMAYLMTDASFCTPSTWDIMLYSYGFNEDKIMHEYFRTVNRYPNKIIYIHTGRDDVLSIDTEDYQFNDFVHANYHLTYERAEEPFPIKMFERR